MSENLDVEIETLEAELREKKSQRGRIREGKKQELLEDLEKILEALREYPLSEKTKNDVLLKLSRYGFIDYSRNVLDEYEYENIPYDDMVEPGKCTEPWTFDQAPKKLVKRLRGEKWVRDRARSGPSRDPFMDSGIMEVPLRRYS